jgi:hypothetical protein
MKSTFTPLFWSRIYGLFLPLKMPFFTVVLVFLSLLDIQLLYAQSNNCACISRVNVTLDRNCQFNLTPQQIGLGSCNKSNLKVTVDDRNPANGGIIDCPGLFKYIVRDASNVLVCSGEVLAEDKGGVLIDGVEFFNGTLLCSDINFVLNNNKTIGSLSNSTSRYPLYTGSVIDTDVKNLGIVNFSDNCKTCGCNVTVNFSDRVDYLDCSETLSAGLFARIYRTWVATDCNGAKRDTTQVINFRRPAIGEFKPTNASTNPFYQSIVMVQNCTADASILTKEQQWPYVTNYWGKKFYLNELDCKYGTAVQDITFPTCNGRGIKIDRKILVMDWCSGQTYEAFRYLIQIGDLTPPSITKPAKGVVVSTRPMDCTGTFPTTASGLQQLGISLVDNCSSVSFSIRIRSKGKWVNGIQIDAVNWYDVDYQVIGGVFVGIPAGQHQAIIDLYDGCGNKTQETLDFTVQDRIAPVMVCDNKLNITLSNGNGYSAGYGRVDAKDVDEGSWDNCGLKWLKVRRNVTSSCEINFINSGYDTNGDGKLDKDDGFTIENSKKYTPLADFAEFFCCDAAAPVEIQLWGEDLSGNRNYCWEEILIEDKVSPTCMAPANLTILCDDKGLGTLDSKKLSALAYGDIRIMSGNDCVGLDTAYSVVRKLNNCGAGTIERIWTLTKKSSKGSLTTTCRQVITVGVYHEYDICFPKDATSDCKKVQADSILTKGLGCDILAVNVSDKRYDASGDECYKIFRTYTVINWCTYDDRCGDPMKTGSVYVVDRKWSNSGASQICVLVRDPNRYGNEKFFLSRDRTVGTTFLSDGKVDVANDEQFVPPFCNVSGEYYHSFMYTQQILVKDDIRPVVKIPTLKPYCTDPNTCLGSVTISFRASDNCTESLDLETQQIFIAPNKTVIQSGILPPTVFDPKWSTRKIGNDSFSISIANLPEGKHDLLAVVRDACGNLSLSTRIPFEVKDCKAPVPTCINGLSTSLMPDGKGAVAMIVWVTDFIASPAYDCNGQGPETKNGLKKITKYSVNRIGVTSQISQTNITVDCNDAGKQLAVEIHAWDEAGNQDFCVTTLKVDDNRGLCKPGGPSNFGTIAGAIGTEINTKVEGVQMNLSGGATMMYMTDNQGAFNFANLPIANNYLVTPEKDGDAKNGVTTYDLILVQKHVLGTGLLDSPYKMIAADVNNSRTITTLDIILIRKMILGLDTQFPNNKSWRFIPYRYKFPDASNPWQETFPETATFTDLGSEALTMDASFMAIKVGDVNNSAIPTAAAPRNAPAQLVLNIANKNLVAGDEITVPVQANLSEVQGYQFALWFDPAKLEMTKVSYGVGQAEHYSFHPEAGVIATSWNQVSKQSTTNDQTVLFTLILKAKSATNIAEALKLYNRAMAPEAYNTRNEVLGIDLQMRSTPVVSTRLELLQNVPNPFSGETLIGFNLPESGEAILTIQDVTGRTIQVIRQPYAEGYNQVRIKSNTLPKSGIFYYTLIQKGATVTKKMVFVE